MKIKYLPAEDRHNLSVLRHAADSQIKISVLESIFQRPCYTMQALWEYRKWFLELTDEQLVSHPSLVCGLAQIFLLSGELHKACVLLEKLEKGSPYYLMTKMTLPGVDHQEWIDIVRRLKEKGWRSNGLTVTAGRPSL